MKQFLSRTYTIAKRCSADQLNVYAAQSSFFIVISAIPLIMLLVTLVQFISPVSQADLMNAILELVPNSLNSYVVTLVDELYNNSSAAIISISALAIRWSASKGTYALELGIGHGFLQEGETAEESFIPDFDLQLSENNCKNGEKK